MIRIITIEREYGSGTATIAEKLAARLGWKLWEKREERRDPLYYRLLKSFVCGSYEGSRGARIEMLDAASTGKISEQVVT